MCFSANAGAVKVLTVWISIAGIAGCALASALAGIFTPWLLIGAGFLGGVTCFAALWYPPRYAAALRGSFDGVAVRVTTGVFRQREIFVPVDALRTFEVGSTPIQRLFGCRTVILRFAGGAAVLPLLPAPQAESLIQALESAENQEDEAP